MEDLKKAMNKKDFSAAKKLLFDHPELVHTKFFFLNAQLLLNIKNIGSFLSNSKADIDLVIENAIESENIVLIELLIDIGLYYDESGIDLKYLCAAAAAGSNDVIEVFLKYGAKINGQDEQGYTPLHFAVGHQKYETVKYLLNKGANISVVSKDGMTPISSLKFCRYNETMYLLLQHILIKELAKQVTLNGCTLTQMDLEFLNNHEEIQSLYKNCLTELTDIKKYYFFHHIRMQMF